MPKLLLVDDDREMLEITAAGFREKGYTVYLLGTGEKALEFIRNNAVDCVILDVMMPGMDGFSLCRAIRKYSSVPVIFLTGRVSEEDKVDGLLLGADDYMEKPYSFRELEARVRVVIRRTQSAAPGKLLFPPLEVDIEGHRALCDGEDLQLTPREYDILYYFVTADKDLLTYEDIGSRIWRVYREKDRSSVMVLVSRLRKKLEGNPITARMIETVWATGYRFIGKKAGGQSRIGY